MHPKDIFADEDLQFAKDEPDARADIELRQWCIVVAHDIAGTGGKAINAEHMLSIAAKVYDFVNGLPARQETFSANGLEKPWAQHRSDFDPPQD